MDMVVRETKTGREIRHNELFDLLDSSCNKFIKELDRRTFNAIMVDAENFRCCRSLPPVLHRHPLFDASSVSREISTIGCASRELNTKEDCQQKKKSVGFQLQIRVRHDGAGEIQGMGNGEQ